MRTPANVPFMPRSLSLSLSGRPSERARKAKFAALFSSLFFAPFFRRQSHKLLLGWVLPPSFGPSYSHTTGSRWETSAGMGQREGPRISESWWKSCIFLPAAGAESAIHSFHTHTTWVTLPSPSFYIHPAARAGEVGRVQSLIVEDRKS